MFKVGTEESKQREGDESQKKITTPAYSIHSLSEEANNL